MKAPRCARAQRWHCVGKVAAPSVTDALRRAEAAVTATEPAGSQVRLWIAAMREGVEAKLAQCTSHAAEGLSAARASEVTKERQAVQQRASVLRAREAAVARRVLRIKAEAAARLERRRADAARDEAPGALDDEDVIDAAGLDLLRRELEMARAVLRNTASVVPPQLDQLRSLVATVDSEREKRRLAPVGPPAASRRPAAALFDVLSRRESVYDFVTSPLSPPPPPPPSAPPQARPAPRPISPEY
ncbi:hypothetical protein M885DRAFT_552327 [Pelagophyceae sp. CCMP2097]|nr:hypothetical protein M885DRAFT_552327 [Pelagophyceae sp. CCMP2097]